MFYGVASPNQAKRMNKFVNLLLLEIYSLLHILWLTDHSVAKLASKPILHFFSGKINCCTDITKVFISIVHIII